MRFTATDKYLMYANSPAKTVSWKVYARKVSVLNTALTSGTWVECTKRILQIPAHGQSLEVSISQTTADALGLTGIDIAWWDANIFNASASEYIEVKVQFYLGLESDVCTDDVRTFAGFINKNRVSYDDASDTVSFTVYSAEELAGGFAAENLTTQYVEIDVDGAGTDGLRLHDIWSTWVTDANIASYVLKAGVHTITYHYESGPVYTMSLDGGDAVTISADDDFYVLGNGVGVADTERLEVYVAGRNYLPTSAIDIEEKIVVTSAGDTLPRQWYRDMGAAALLRKIYAMIGVDTVDFDTLELSVAPSPAPAVGKVSFVDLPPSDTSVYGVRWAMTNDGTDLWVAVGNTVYQRTMTAGTGFGVYTLRATLGGTDKISKLMYNARNNDLWIFYGPNANGNGKLRRYDITGDSLSAEVSLSTTLDETRAQAVEVFDFEYDGAGGWHYSVVYTKAESGIREVLASDLSDNEIFSKATLSVTNLYSSFLHQLASGKVRFKTYRGGANEYTEIQLNSSEVWVDNGSKLSGIESYDIACYSSDDDRVYYWQDSTGTLSSHTTSATLKTDNLVYGTPSEVNTIHPATGGGAYFTLWLGTGSYYDKANYRLYFVQGTSAAAVKDSGVHTPLTSSAGGGWGTSAAMTYMDSRMWGLDRWGRLWSYGTTLSMFVANADFEGETVRDALNRVLGAFLLVATTTADKKAHVYRRCDDNGDPVSTGNTVAVTVTNADQISMETGYTDAAALADVDNGSVRFTFNGTAYDTEVLSDASRVSISNSLIPDEIVQDVCYYLYQFFATSRSIFNVRLGVVPLFQYEPLDAAALTFTTTRLVKSATGVIYKTRYAMDGSVIFGVMV